MVKTLRDLNPDSLKKEQYPLSEGADSASQTVERAQALRRLAEQYRSLGREVLLALPGNDHALLEEQVRLKAYIKELRAYHLAHLEPVQTSATRPESFELPGYSTPPVLPAESTHVIPDTNKTTQTELRVGALVAAKTIQNMSYRQKRGAF